MIDYVHVSCYFSLPFCMFTLTAGYDPQRPHVKAWVSNKNEHLPL
jgi:hypothetical protein